MLDLMEHPILNKVDVLQYLKMILLNMLNKNGRMRSGDNGIRVAVENMATTPHHLVRTMLGTSWKLKKYMSCRTRYLDGCS